MSADLRRVLATAIGRVQGVGYRAWTEDTARRLGVRGWVKNQPDGSVAAMLEGSEQSVELMLVQMKIGPALARIDEIKQAEQPPGESFIHFSVRY